MQEIYSRIDEALVMAGLTGDQVKQIKAGARIYGTDGQVDSLGLVRLISSVSTGFEDFNIDLFDMMVDLDVEAVEAFADRNSIFEFMMRIIRARQPEVV